MQDIHYFGDPGGQLTIDEVEALLSERWLPHPSLPHMTLPLHEVVWMRVVLKNTGTLPQTGVLENADFFADRADAWIGKGSTREHRISGESVAATENKLPGREVAFPVIIPADGEQVVILRLKDFSRVYVRLEWWPDATDFHIARTHGNLAEGVYLGMLLALLGYNLVLWLRLRQPDIRYYVLYLGAVAVFMFLARAQIPAMGGALGSPAMETALTFSIALIGPFLIQFTRHFLDLRKHLPRLDLWLSRWSILLVVLAALSLTLPWVSWPSWYRVITQAAAVTHVGLLIVAIISWRAGVWQAKFFVASFGCLFAGSFPILAVSLMVLPFRDIAMRGFMIGSALEMLLLSLAVAERFTRMQRKLVVETEQRRVIEEMYADELEEEVRLRTRELHTANADKDHILSVIGHDLRAPLTGLMRSSDGDSGELAKNVAQTSRTLLLMIEDLVLWTRLRTGARTTGVHRMNALILPAVTLHKVLAESEGIALEVDVPDDLRVETDLVLAQTLVRNLLANALKFARTKVTLRAAITDDGVRFTVGNDGPVLSPEVAARLAAGEDGPMTATGGLGLRLCREICQALDTRLEASTPPTGGTEFGFTMKRITVLEKESV